MIKFTKIHVAIILFALILTITVQTAHSQSAAEAKKKYEQIVGQINDLNSKMAKASADGDNDGYEKYKAEYETLKAEAGKLNSILAGDANTKKKINSVKKMYNEGTTSLKLRRYAEAIANFDKAIAEGKALGNPLLDGVITNANYNKGQAYYAQKNWSAMKSAMNDAITIKPTFDKAYFMLGMAEAKMSNTAAAIAAYQKAIEINPGYSKAHLNLGTIYMSSSKFDQAITSLMNVVQLESQNAKAYRYLGRSYFEKREYNSAVGALEQSIKLDRSKRETHWFLARSLNKLGQYSRARTAANSIVSMSPKYGGGHLELGVALKGLGQKGPAIAAFQAAASDRSFRQQAEYEIKWYDKGSN